MAGFMQRRREAKVQADAHLAYRAWESANDQLTRFSTLAREYHGDRDAAGFVLKKDEVGYFTVLGAALIEPRRAPGHYEGGYSGVSFRIAKGVSYHTGATKGHFVPGPESPTVIDDGNALITNQRVIFTGGKQSREWLYSKLLGYTHNQSGWTALQVSNRQKVSGIAYGPGLLAQFQFFLALALADLQDGRDGLIQQITSEIAQHNQQRPALPQGAT